jgi:hypothetical protein
MWLYTNQGTSFFSSRFDVDNKPHVLRFVEALATVLINGQPIKVEFGGLPKPIIVRGKKHFIRFTVLPRGIKPGYANIINMEGGRLPSPPRPKNENSDTVSFGGEDSNDTSSRFSQGHEPVLPVVGKYLLRVIQRMQHYAVSLNRLTVFLCTGYEIYMKFQDLLNVYS